MSSAAFNRAAACRARATHGMRYVPEYRVWINMRGRCNDPNRDNYPWYGGRGIKVCARWESFENFYTDMGPRPSDRHSIERLDNYGDYEPGNCQWTIPTAQANNKRNNRIVVYFDVEMSLSDALRAAGNVVKKSTARLRLVKWGWSVDRAVETPAALQGRA